MLLLGISLTIFNQLSMQNLIWISQHKSKSQFVQIFLSAFDKVLYLSVIGSTYKFEQKQQGGGILTCNS